MTIDLSDIVNMLANSLFNGNVTIAGMVIFITVLALIFALFRDLKISLIISMPVALVFNQLNVLDTNMMILLIIVAVLGLAAQGRLAYKE